MFVINLPFPQAPHLSDRAWQVLVVAALSLLSVFCFIFYYRNGLGVAYNDARSHLDIGRRVVESLKPGAAQLGSVWLPLNHILMLPTIGNDFMWHSGLSGALESMIAFVATGWLIYRILDLFRVGLLGRLTAVVVFASNINVLYLQSTAMTELLLLLTMTAGCYYLLVWHKSDRLLDLIKSAFWIMLSTLVRYDGWFLLLFAILLVAYRVWSTRGYKTAEGLVILFTTLGAYGIGLWFLWNQVIFKDALYFALGPFSAHAQQAVLSQAGNLASKHNLWLSTKIYLYALFYNSYTVPALFAFWGFIALILDRRLSGHLRLGSVALLSPLAFNIVALYLGFSVLFVMGISGNTLFNVRYGVMLLPSIAIFTGYLVDRLKSLRPVLIGLLLFVLFFAFTSGDAVTIDDARVGSSQKNVTEVAEYLHSHALYQPGFILISVASHDAIIFSSGLPMSRFIHEGTGTYWTAATTAPDHWARWIVMRTYDNSDLTWKFVHDKVGFQAYHLVDHYPFADVYEIDPRLLHQLHTTPDLPPQR